MPCSRPGHPDHKASRGFTLVELLIVIGVIVVLIALLLPSVASVRARARTAECQSNLTQLGLALKAANRNRSTPVRSSSWAADIAPFLEGENEELFVCPADFQAENRNAEEQDPTNPQFKGSFGANNQMHRMQGSDANKFTLVDLGDGDADGTNESQFFVVPRTRRGQSMVDQPQRSSSLGRRHQRCVRSTRRQYQRATQRWLCFCRVE